MSKQDKFKELIERYRQLCIENKITITIYQYPFTHKYYPLKNLMIDSLSKLKP